MSLFEDTNPHALKQLLADIHSRTMVLPDFQRNFVWDPGDTQDLIVSIANNYPAGSLLRVRDGQHVFACRQFEGAPPLNGHRHTFLVLDGQQRLTSLYQAFYGVGEHRYYLRLKDLCEGAEFEDAIFHERASSPRAKRLEDETVQAAELLLPLSELEGGAGRFTKWFLKAARKLPIPERTKLEDSLGAVDDRWIKVIDDYFFPVVTLSDKTSPAALCTIFETLNRTGVKLSAFELLTARFWPKDIKLRELWQEAIVRHPIVTEFEVDPYYVLQAIELASSPAPSGKRSAVMDLTDQQVRDWWKPVTDGLAAALTILRDDCHVLMPKWLPYQTMLPPLAAVMARQASKKAAAAGAARERLVRWFWCATFGQAYESSPNSQGARDVVALTSWLNGGDEPDAVRHFSFDPAVLRRITPRQRAVYRGTVCLLLGNAGGARDFHSQGTITAALVRDEGIDDHHVFPADFLKTVKGETDPQVRDSVLNRTLIDRETNQRISNRAPSDYLTEMRDEPGFTLDPILASHTLPTGVDSPFWTDDFDRFLDWRQERLGLAIQRVTRKADAQ